MTRVASREINQNTRNKSALQRQSDDGHPAFIYSQQARQEDSVGSAKPQPVAKPINFDFTGYGCGEEPTDDDEQSEERSSISSFEQGPDEADSDLNEENVTTETR